MIHWIFHAYALIAVLFLVFRWPNNIEEVNGFARINVGNGFYLLNDEYYRGVVRGALLWPLLIIFCLISPFVRS